MLVLLCGEKFDNDECRTYLCVAVVLCCPLLTTTVITAVFNKLSGLLHHQNYGFIAAT